MRQRAIQAKLQTIKENWGYCLILEILRHRKKQPENSENGSFTPHFDAHTSFLFQKQESRIKVYEQFKMYVCVDV